MTSRRVQFAARAGSEKCLTLLLDAGANARSVDGRGRTALMEVRGADAGKLVEALIGDGAEVDARDKYGCTALMRAAQRGVPGVRP